MATDVQKTVSGEPVFGEIEITGQPINVILPDTQEISINSVDDSITIGDENGNKATVTGNSLNTNITGTVLAANAATEAKQDIGNASLSSIDAKLTNPFPVSVSSLPLPSGAATESTLAAILAQMQSNNNLLFNQNNNVLVNEDYEELTRIP